MRERKGRTEVGERGSLSSGSTRSTDSVDVVLAVVGEVVVDDVLDVLDTVERGTSQQRERERTEEMKVGTNSAEDEAERTR
jgi:hypothetical protein